MNTKCVFLLVIRPNSLTCSSVLEHAASPSTWYVRFTMKNRHIINTWFIGEGPPEADGYIEPSKPQEEVRQEPYPLPNDFEWSTLDINDPVQVISIPIFLISNVDFTYRTKRSMISFHSITWRTTMPPSVSSTAQNFSRGESA